MSNEEKKTVSDFEKFVFGVTRVFALCGAVAVVIAIIILAMALLSPGTHTNVSYSEIANEMAASGKLSASEPEAEAELVPIPKDLKAFLALGPEIEMNLRRMIEGLSEPEQRDYLNNLAEVIREATAKNADLLDVANEYTALKSKKRSSITEFDKYMTIAVKAGYVAIIFGLLLILCILSLVLVMLAIERNTRPAST
jgi:hypothetical protein